MARIKIKCRNPNDRDNKLKLIEIHCKTDIEIRRIVYTHDGFAVLAINEHNSDTKLELAQNGFRPFIPPDLNARKSVIIPRVDDLVYEKKVVDIISGNSKENDWINKNEIENTYKFPNSPTLKITFTLSLLAKKNTQGRVSNTSR